MPFSAGMGVSEYCKDNENAKLDFEGFFNELVNFAKNQKQYYIIL